jgi:hypothetical protein
VIQGQVESEHVRRKDAKEVATDLLGREGPQLDARWKRGDECGKVGLKARIVKDQRTMEGGAQSDIPSNVFLDLE